MVLSLEAKEMTLTMGLPTTKRERDKDGWWRTEVSNFLAAAMILLQLSMYPDSPMVTKLAQQPAIRAPGREPAMLGEP